MARPRIFSLICVAIVLFLTIAIGEQDPGNQRRPPPALATTILINKTIPTPAWALAERALLKSAADGAQLWVDRYLDADGAVNVVPHWGVSDGPDDVMEYIRGWPLAYAMGAPETVIQLFERAWEGHLRQFSKAKLPARSAIT